MAQIRLLEDAEVNPLTGEPWPGGHQTRLQDRRELPAYTHFDMILSTYHENQVFVVASEIPGSGKSTQVPQLLLYDEFTSGLQVVCTQTRWKSAISLANRVSKELGVQLGEEVGYELVGESKVNLNDKQTRLTYVTDEWLVNQHGSDKNLSAYACIIVDDAHERTVDTEILLAMLKNVIERRKDLKVVLMSALEDTTKKFQDYFNQCRFVHLDGGHFNVAMRYTTPTSDFTVMATRVVDLIHQNHDPGNILVFLPGRSEISQVCNLIREKAACEDLDVSPLHSKLGVDEQEQTYISGPKRKCIVSTNITETGPLIENVRYVIDTGLSQQKIYNPFLDMQMIQVQPISQAAAKKRASRAGETAEGFCYRLFDKENLDRLDPLNEPGIRTTAVHKAALKVLRAGFAKVVDFDWVDAPHLESLARANQDLRDWGFLNDNSELTESGALAAVFPLDPIWFRAISEAAKLGCSSQMVDIAVMCSFDKSIFQRPHQREAAEFFKRPFTHFPSDHLTLLYALNSYERARKKSQEIPCAEFDLDAWCKSNFLDHMVLVNIMDVRKRVRRFLKNTAKITLSSTSITDPKSILKALAIGLCTQIAMCHGDDDEYQTVHGDVPGRLHPLSALVNGNFLWIVYSKFTMTAGGNVYMKTASPINPEWLLDLPYFQEGRLPLEGNGNLRQPQVQKSLDNAKARMEAKQSKWKEGLEEKEVFRLPLYPMSFDSQS